MMADVRPKLMAVGEVIVVVLVASLLFRVLGASPLHQWEVDTFGNQSVFAMGYAAVLVFVLGFLRITRRSFAAYGITFRHPRYLVRVVVTALLPVLMLSLTLSLVDWRRWVGALVVSAVALLALVIIGWTLRGKVPPTEMAILGIAAGLLPVTLVWADSVLGSALVKTLYIYLLVGPAEEVLFRGYAQTRLNEAWGRPHRFFDVSWGFGVVGAAVLFGLWHALLMPSAPGVWLQVLWTSCAGLVFGYLRERSASVVPSSLLHSFMNYVPFSEWLVG